LFVRALEDRTVPATFTVLNLHDSGSDSLRDCINKANANPGPDTIGFQQSLAGAITLTTGELAVSDAVTIQGPGANSLSINGNKAGRILNLIPAPDGAAITITGLTFTGGKADIGAAIFSSAQQVTMNQCVLTGNTATGFGGAMLAAGTVLTMNQCSITDNNSLYGALASGFGAKTTLKSCTISGNKAEHGAGIFAAYYLLVENSTIAGNKANATYGGGLEVGGTFAPGALTIRNSTISGNSAGQSGGGIALTNFAGTLNVQSCTIFSNTGFNSGGGIAQISGIGTVQLFNTIVAQNYAFFGVGPDMSFYKLTSVAADFSIVGVADEGGFTLPGLGNQTGTLSIPLDVKLASLANYGGPTQTHHPLAGSPALNKGSNQIGLSTDQRGQPRVFTGVADVGAVEVNPAQFVVTLVGDENDGNLNPNDLSLREALLLANAWPAGVDSITFDPAVFAGSQTITLTLGEIIIAGAVDITGPGSDKMSITGNSRIFNTSSAPTGAAISVSAMRLFGGKGGVGGAIYGEDESLTLNDCSLHSNVASESGGAVYLYQGNVTIRRCDLSNNTAEYNGGAIVGGKLLIEDSVLGGNSSNNSNGGAVFMVSNASATIIRSTLSGNSARYSGGAIYFYNSGSLFVENSTISANTSNISNFTLGGGAVYFFGGANSLVFSNSTISGNSAPDGSGGAICLRSFGGVIGFQNCTVSNNSCGYYGGGICQSSGTGKVNLESSIIADNSALIGQDLLVVGTVTGNYNLIGVADDGNFSLSGVGNLTGTITSPLDAKLGPLANNGGPTKTHALLPGSPAINKGGNPAMLATDQRGTGFGRNVNGVDIGAFEVQVAASPPSVTSIVVNNGNEQRSLVTTLKVTFSEAVNFPMGLSSAFSLERTAFGSIGPVGLTFVPPIGPTSEVVITFNNSGTVGIDPGSSLADGEYLFTIVADKITGIGGTLDGDGDSISEGSPSDNKTVSFHRLFGDADGNGMVNSSDFAVFRTFFGLGASMFDFTGDGQTNSNDFAEFRKRFGISVVP